MVSSRRIIGIDESGKVYFFGPLVVAGFLCSTEDAFRLLELDVRDSKKLAEAPILRIAARLREEFPHKILVISPPEYNKRYAEIKNLNKLLADGHAEVIQYLTDNNEVDMAISDKFGKSERLETALARRNCTLDVKQLVRGESILQVAAASILARAAFVEEMEKLGQSIGANLPKGAAAQVDEAGREIVSSRGPEVLAEISKLHFKNYQRIVTLS